MQAPHLEYTGTLARSVKDGRGAVAVCLEICAASITEPKFWPRKTCA